MKITIVAGARPNFIKIAPIIHEIEKKKSQGFNIDYRLVHTGQHYDKNMSDSFFKELNIPDPHSNLSCFGGSQTKLTAKIMIEFEKELLNNFSDLVLVVGDVTSTMACAVVAQKLKIKVAHVEGGIRSYDWSMPEEINRLITDSITNYFFTTSITANNNLLSSGVDKDSVFFVGNTMIDTLLKNKSKFKQPKIWDLLNLKKKGYIIITLHRPANVDEELKLKTLLNEILANINGYDLIFPMHPRTKKVFDKLNLCHEKLHIIDPLSYLEFNFLVKNSLAVITDSGGITEETTVMGIPCITLRDNTERPETITEGTNELVGTDPKSIPPVLSILFSGNWKEGKIPYLWDGNTSKRIVEHLLKLSK